MFFNFGDHPGTRGRYKEIRRVLVAFRKNRNTGAPLIGPRGEGLCFDHFSPLWNWCEKGVIWYIFNVFGSFSPFPRAGWNFLYLYFDLRACRPSVISGRVIQPGPRTPARITGGPRHRARTATKIRIPVLWLYPWGLLKWPQMTRFTHWSCYYDIRDGATHLGQNENESRVKRIFQKIQLFFFKPAEVGPGGRWGGCKVIYLGRIESWTRIWSLNYVGFQRIRDFFQPLLHGASTTI